MRLLILTSEYPPNGAGIANVVHNIVLQLEKAGIECTICSPTGPDIIRGSQRLIARTGVIGLIHFWLDARDVINNNDRFDAIWMQNPFLLHKTIESPAIVTMHSTYRGSSDSGIGSPMFNFYKKLASLIERYCLKTLGDKVVFTGVGSNVCRELESIGIQSDRIHFIPNGVDTARFEPFCENSNIRDRYGISSDDFMLLSVGRLTHQKSPLKLLRTFKDMTSLSERIMLCLCGRGELLDDVENYIKENSMKNVILTGYVPDVELPGLYSCSDAYVMSSDYEGGMPPLTLAEALASGLPSIVSDIENLKWVEEYGCGKAVDFNNHQNAANDIVGYINGDLDSAREKARAYSVEVLDWSNISKQYQKILNELVPRF